MSAAQSAKSRLRSCRRRLCAVASAMRRRTRRWRGRVTRSSSKPPSNDAVEGSLNDVFCDPVSSCQPTADCIFVVRYLFEVVAKLPCAFSHPLECDAKCRHRGLRPLQEKEAVRTRQSPFGVAFAGEKADWIEVRQSERLHDAEQPLKRVLVRLCVRNQIELGITGRIKDPRVA